MLYIGKKELLNSLYDIMQAMHSKELAPLYDSNDVAQYDVEQRVKAARFKLSHADDIVAYSFPILPDDLIEEWETFRKREDLSPTQQTKIDFGNLVKKTLQFIEYIRSLPRLRSNPQMPVSTEDRKNVRMMDVEQINSEMKRLESMYSEASRQLEEAKKKGKAKEEEATKLSEIIKGYEAKILELRENKDAHENDQKSEVKWNERLTSSFEELSKKSSGLCYEIRVARIEYFLCIGLMTVATIFIARWYCGFYEELTQQDSPINITSWISYLPYALPVTVYIAVMWILIVQKNRASKISVSLSTRQANVQYLEGLLKLVNRLSSDSETAVKRINDIVGKMIDSYIRQLESTNVTEKNIEKIEEKEQGDVPQQKVLNEIKKYISHD